MRRVSLQWRENQMSGGEKFRHWIKIRTSQLARDYSPIIITWRDSYFSKWSWDSPIVHQWLTGRQIHSLYPYSTCSAICGVFLATQSCRAPVVFWEKLYKAARKKSWKWAPSEFKGVTLTAEFNAKCKFLNTLISAAQTKNSLHFTIRRRAIRYADYLTACVGYTSAWNGWCEPRLSVNFHENSLTCEQREKSAAPTSAGAVL